MEELYLEEPTMKYRELRTEEIAQLERNGCVCENWSGVKVAWGDASYTDRIVNVTFSGEVRLGSCEGYHCQCEYILKVFHNRCFLFFLFGS